MLALAHLIPFLFGTAVAFILLSIPLILGLVPRNRWYGVRTPRSLHGTEEDWYAVNRKGGFVLLSLSFATLLVLAGYALL